MKKRFILKTLSTALMMSLVFSAPIYAEKTSQRDPSLELSLDEIEGTFSLFLRKVELSQEKMESLSQKVLQAPVCSEANRAFNEFAKMYTEYLVDNYTTILYLKLYKIKYMEEYNGQEPSFIEETILTLDKSKEKFENLYPKLQERADALFEEYYSEMCHIVNAEAGGCNSSEHYYVANVIENRIKSSKFPNTIHSVIWQSGQYSPTWNGAIRKTPLPSVLTDIENYLRGRIETGMPDNVLYQAGFRQGRGVWKHTSSGHYYCY